VFAPGNPNKPSLIFEGKVRSLPLSGAPKRCFILLGCIISHKQFTRLERLARDKRFSLL